MNTYGHVLPVLQLEAADGMELVLTGSRRLSESSRRKLIHGGSTRSLAKL
jgi:hypothetical protein